MSLSVDPEIQERLKKVAKKRNISVSKLVRDMVDKHFGTDNIEENTVDTVILKIPTEIKGKPEELKQWLQVRFDGIFKVFTA